LSNTVSSPNSSPRFRHQAESVFDAGLDVELEQVFAVEDQPAA